jgi:hypothetical protein
MTVAFLMLILAMGLGSSVMLGGFIWILSRLRRLELAGPGRDDPHHLLERMDALRDEVAALQDEQTRLIERVDFTERLLEPGSPTDPEAP